MILLCGELKFLHRSHNIIHFSLEIYFFLQQQFQCKTDNHLNHDYHHRKHILGDLFILMLCSCSSILYPLHFLLFPSTLYIHQVVMKESFISNVSSSRSWKKSVRSGSLNFLLLMFYTFLFHLPISITGKLDIGMHNISRVSNAFQS